MPCFTFLKHVNLNATVFLQLRKQKVQLEIFTFDGSQVELPLGGLMYSRQLYHTSLYTLCFIDCVYSI
jgi:hypothetical protein